MTLTLEAGDLLQYIPGIMWVVDREMKCIAIVGEKFEEWKVDRNDIIGKMVAEINHEEPSGLNNMNHQKALSDREVSYQVTIGDEFLECKLRYLPEKELIVGVAIDVSKSLFLEEKLESQKREILEYSTPIVPVLDHAVVLPIVKKLTLEKVRYIQKQVVQGIYELKGIEYVIIDLSGVQRIDQSSHEAFQQLHTTLNLLGYQAIVTGIQKSTAMEIVRNGSQINADIVYPNLKEAVKSLLV
ncbi:STAS domain-containing protein [Planomicrobium sp. CPCC 101079]|uniref:STAS domain-containing protein n=1 Tax=Planomicrobium sp. CPCC 101079 TaxID=2599618 RepID=UPI0011B3644D|nr:STAS domain-containing protein [Planomicrobium sp. CPCC 101079]TWT09266.1 STAS domain-containing protein [Planomicrobium sp. CPCC 101079]